MFIVCMHHGMMFQDQPGLLSDLGCSSVVELLPGSYKVLYCESKGLGTATLTCTLFSRFLLRGLSHL